jgi:hypothetical protein
VNQTRHAGRSPGLLSALDKGYQSDITLISQPRRSLHP